MKKYHIYTLIFFVFILLLIGFSSAFQKQAVIKSPKIDSKVYSSLENNPKIEVIIAFNQSYKPSKKGLYLTSSFGNNLKNRALREYKGLAIVKISKDELNSLADSPEIKKVFFPHQIKAFLQDTVSIVNATKTWQLKENNLNITGIDETICVIDTGINFTHPDLIGKNKTCTIDCFEKTCVKDCSISDDNGHGTHVAGIIAAQGEINGIAVGASLIGVKVLDSLGYGSDSSDLDIANAIDWCVENRQNYNISVISMSLGTIDYLNASYCDLDFDPFWTDPINNAIYENISVIAASGNSGSGVPRSTTQIAAPACITNVTSVSATDKDDSISSYGHYNSLLDLFAPGTNILSTGGPFSSECARNGNYMTCSGTSMATPHVSAAFVLIRQFYNLQNRMVLTPQQIESTLKNHGKNITASGLNFTRINIYDAIISLDSQAPNVSLILPASSTNTLDSNVTFRCNASDLALKNVTFYLWNSSSGIINQTSRNVSGQINIFEINITNLSADSYKWNCLYFDENNNLGLASSNFTLNMINMLTSLVSPLNNTSTNQNQTFSCNSSSSTGITNVTFYLWNSSSLENISFKNVSGLFNLTNFAYNFTHEGNYSWNCLFANNLTNWKSALSNFSLSYDLTPPEIILDLPSRNNSENYGIFKINLNEPGNCTYSLNLGALNQSMNSSNGLNFTAYNTSTLNQNQSYNIEYYCNDSAGNRNFKLINFIADFEEPVVTLAAPINFYSLTGSSRITFQYNVSDNANISSCVLMVNDILNLTESNITNQSNTYSFNQTFGIGSYSWRINCTDDAGNIGNSSSRSITISAPTQNNNPTGGGGVGSSTATIVSYTLSVLQLKEGRTQEFGKNDKIILEINKLLSSLNNNAQEQKTENHSIFLDDIGKNSVNLTIRSNPIKVFLFVGQEFKANLTSQDYYDIYIKLEGIANNKANLTVKSINEKINNSFALNKQNETSDKDTNTTILLRADKSNKPFFDLLNIKWLEIILAVLVLVLALIKGIGLVNKKRKQNSLLKEIIDIKKDIPSSHKHHRKHHPANSAKKKGK